MNLLDRLRRKKTERAIPSDRFERLKERVKLQSEGLRDDSRMLLFMDDDNRDLRLTEWGAAAPVAPAAEPSVAPAVEDHRRYLGDTNIEDLVGLLQADGGETDPGMPPSR